MRLTKPLLHAMEDAINAMLAGVEGEGDWPEGVPPEHFERALIWVREQLERREEALCKK